MDRLMQRQNTDTVLTEVARQLPHARGAVDLVRGEVAELRARLAQLEDAARALADAVEFGVDAGHYTSVLRAVLDGKGEPAGAPPAVPAQLITDYLDALRTTTRKGSSTKRVRALDALRAAVGHEEGQ